MLQCVRVGMVAVVLGVMGGCATSHNYVPTNLSMEEAGRVEDGKLVRLQQVLPTNAAEKLVLSQAAYPNGVFVCAIQDMSTSCLPKLSAKVAGKLAQHGVPVTAEQGKADATGYFETWFDSYSSHSDMVKSALDNPTLMGKTFAGKMEQSFATGTAPDVHKHFHFAVDPLSLIAINSNDEQKFIYVALTAVDMKDAATYPGEGKEGKGASNNPWVKNGSVPTVRTLIGNYDGEVATEEAVSPMLEHAIELLAQRVTQSPQM